VGAARRATPKSKPCDCTSLVNALLIKEKGYGLDLAFTVPTKKGEKGNTYPQIKLHNPKPGEILTPTYCPFCGNKYSRK
jgi:hypothetical protein